MPRSLKKSPDTLASIPESSKTPPKPVGRPSKFTDDVRTAIIDSIEAGATYDQAAQCAGIAPSTLFDWKAKGEAGEADFSDFLEQLKTAEAKGDLELLKRIRYASTDPKLWTAAAWILERRHPETWGKQKIDLHHTGSLSWEQMVSQAQGGKNDSD